MKIHFKDSLDRLTEGETIQANCGQVVVNAKFPMMIDLDKLGLQEISGISNCRTCLMIGEKIPKRHYLYGIVSGEESQQAARRGAGEQ